MNSIPLAPMNYENATSALGRSCQILLQYLSDHLASLLRMKGLRDWLLSCSQRTQYLLSACLEELSPDCKKGRGRATKTLVMKSSSLTLFLGSLATVVFASAVPVPVAGPVAGPGDGLNFRAVQFNPSIVHNILGAEAALGWDPSDPRYVSEVSGVLNRIDMADGNYVGENTSAHDAVPFAGADPLFAIRYSGFLNVVEPGPYVFSSFTDDGFKLTLGGQVISAFNADRSPGTSTTPSILLAAGLYEIEFIGWEQGETFVNELAWLTPNATGGMIVPDSTVFFRNVPVPDAGSTSALLGFAIIGLAYFRRNIHA